MAPFSDRHMQFEKAFPEDVVEILVLDEPSALIPGLFPEVDNIRNQPVIAALPHSGYRNHDETFSRHWATRCHGLG
ncbi:hypothetical protein [Ochrobactrum soli]|uniref:Uncharacterized protein n=1 Tax=Ochrobactrum soli TaxID=2448455 RepID=A0A849KMW6_9HYPH|nr:hypothetical protein [[Ochrobactrum] soli]NNU60990.1 hypothetical protein [[Ochrobactrum] soli]